MVLVLWAFVAVFHFLFAPQIVAGMKAFERVSRDDDAFIEEISRRLASHYRCNAATIDRVQSYPLDAALLWKQLGITPKPNLRMAVSERIAGGQVRFRRFVVWLVRAQPDPSSFDALSGAFVPGPGVSFRIVDGEPIQNALLEETLTRMKMFAAQLEKRFRAKFQSDPLRSLDVNHFRALGPSCSAAFDDMPCIDTYTEAAVAADFSLLLSSDGTRFATAWGDPLSVSNKEDSNWESPPYSMAIRAPLPWGEVVLVNAVQPLN